MASATTPLIYDETNYTLLQKYVQAMVGWNLSHVLQIAYTLRDRDVDVEPGTLAGIESLQGRFGPILGVGTTHETLNRLEIIYDTRDDTIDSDARRTIRDFRRRCRARRIVRLLVVQCDRSRCAAAVVTGTR